MQPDLVIQDFSVGFSNLNPPEFNFNYTIENRGEASSGNFNVGFYLSQDKLIDHTDTLLSPINSNTSFSNLDAGQNTDPLSSKAILDGRAITPGEYYVGIFIDNSEMVSESAEDNNTSSRLLPTDLKSSYFNVTPTSAHPGDFIQVEFEIFNDSPFSPSQPVPVQFFLSDDHSIDPSRDFALGGLELVDPSLLNPYSGSGILQATLHLEFWFQNYPYSIGDGTYYIGMIIDPYHQIPERNNYSNNVDSDYLDITKTLPHITIQLPPSVGLDPKHTGTGDTDFDGNGPQLVAIPEVSITPDRRAIEVTFADITFKETKGDGTTFSARYVTALSYDLDDLFRDQGIQGYIFAELDNDGRREGENDKISSNSDEYVFPQQQRPGQRTYEDNNHDVDYLPGGDLISQYAVVGDTDGGLFGGPDQPILQVLAFNPIDVFLAPEQ